jgi:hypothetical protein
MIRWKLNIERNREIPISSTSFVGLCLPALIWVNRSLSPPFLQRYAVSAIATTFMPRCAAFNCALSLLAGCGQAIALRYMRCDIGVAARFDMSGGVIGIVLPPVMRLPAS